MIKNEIISIHNKIVELQLFNRWGGYSVHKTDSSNGIPYGVSLMKDCHGNTYTYDDRVETAGYLSIERFSSSTENRQFVRLPVNYTIHIFNTIAKAGESQRFWSKAILILKELKKYYPDVNIESVITGLPDKVEYAKITIRQQYIVPCDYSFQELDELCEGAGLIDVCEPINPSPIYRNLSTHIAASGDFDMTDAFSGWVPPPYPRDRDTIIVKFDDGLAFFTYKNGTWTFDYFFAGSGGVPVSDVKELSGYFIQGADFPPFGERTLFTLKNDFGFNFKVTYAINIPGNEDYRIEPIDPINNNFLSGKEVICSAFYHENPVTRITTSRNPLTKQNTWNTMPIGYDYIFGRVPTNVGGARRTYFTVRVFDQ